MTDEKSNQLTKNSNVKWVWGIVLIGMGVLFLVTDLLDKMIGFLIPGFILAGVGLVFYTIYARDNKHWWALIPAYAMWLLAAIFVMIALWFPAEWIVAVSLLGAGFPFLYVYLQDNKRWWALIPAYAIAAFAGLPIMIWLDIRAELIIAYFMFANALPFLYIYLRDKKQWWALIPAGVVGSVGLILMLAGAARYVPVVMIVLGIYLIIRQSGKEDRPKEPVAALPAAPKRPITVTTAEPTTATDTPSPDLPIADVGLGARYVSALADAGIVTAGDFINRLRDGGDPALLEVKGFGEKSLIDLKLRLRSRGFDVP